MKNLVTSYLITSKVRVQTLLLKPVGKWRRETEFSNMLCPPEGMSHSACVTQYCHRSRISQFSSIAQSCPTLCEPRDCSVPGFPVHHQCPEFTQIKSIKLVMPSSHLILCCPLLLLLSIFPSIRVFPNESALHIRWPKYWSFSFNISPSHEHPD